MTTNTKEGVYSYQTNPTLAIGLVICLLGIIGSYWLKGSASIVFLIMGAGLALQLWRTKSNGIALVTIEDGELVFLESMEKLNTRTRIRLSDVSEIAVAGFPDDQRYRFALMNGQVVELRPYFQRKYNEEIIQFLKTRIGESVKIDIQGPLSPMEEMHGDFKAP
jgi:hypothetical protein